MYSLLELFEEWLCTFTFYAFYVVLLFDLYIDKTEINNKIYVFFWCVCEVL